MSQKRLYYGVVTHLRAGAYCHNSGHGVVESGSELIRLLKDRAGGEEAGVLVNQWASPVDDDSVRRAAALLS